MFIIGNASSRQRLSAAIALVVTKLDPSTAYPLFIAT
jgi:hypothetical protein